MHPELRGRIAYDVRFELFRESDFERLLRARRSWPGVRVVEREGRVVVER